MTPYPRENLCRPGKYARLYETIIMLHKQLLFLVSANPENAAPCRVFFFLTCENFHLGKK